MKRKKIIGGQNREIQMVKKKRKERERERERERETNLKYISPICFLFK